MRITETLRWLLSIKLVVRWAQPSATVAAFIPEGSKVGDVVDVAGTPMRVRIVHDHRNGLVVATLRRLRWYDRIWVNTAAWFRREIRRIQQVIKG